MKGRKGPRTGYNFGNKKQYRRIIWKAFREFVNNKPQKSALLLPSKEGAEIEVALDNGFKQSDLHVIDRNPAIVATLKRKYPYINTYGVDIEEALFRIPVHEIVVANFDLCGPVSNELFRVFDAVRRSATLAEHSLIAITTLRGRDSRAFISDITDGTFDLSLAQDIVKTCLSIDVSPLDAARIVVPMMAAASQGDSPFERGYRLDPIRSEFYKSSAGNQTMRWALYDCYYSANTEERAA